MPSMNAAVDWPHPTEQGKPLLDDSLLLDRLAVCVPNEAVRNRILVDNPARLFQFN